MKNILILLAVLVSVSGCTTVKQAQTDFQNFQRTIKLNAGQPIVLKNAYF